MELRWLKKLTGEEVLQYSERADTNHFSWVDVPIEQEAPINTGCQYVGGSGILFEAEAMQGFVVNGDQYINAGLFRFRADSITQAISKFYFFPVRNIVKVIEEEVLTCPPPEPPQIHWRVKLESLTPFKFASSEEWGPGVYNFGISEVSIKKVIEKFEGEFIMFNIEIDRPK